MNITEIIFNQTPISRIRPDEEDGVVEVDLFHV